MLEGGESGFASVLQRTETRNRAPIIALTVNACSDDSKNDNPKASHEGLICLNPHATRVLRRTYSQKLKAYLLRRQVEQRFGDQE